MNKKLSKQLPIIGWREWLVLPGLNICRVKAKVDTGARTWALHTFWVDAYKKNPQQWVRFAIHPLQNNTDVVVECDVPELTLTDRDTMKFRMLLGRTAINGRFLVDSRASYLQGSL